MDTISNLHHNPSEIPTSQIDIEDSDPSNKISNVNTSPLSISTDSSDHGALRQGSFQKMDNEDIVDNLNGQKNFNVEEILQSIVIDADKLRKKQDFKSFLISKIEQLSKIAETYFEGSNSKAKSRGFFSNPNILSRIKSKREKKLEKQDIVSSFEDHINTLKATYSDEDPLFDAIDKFADNFNSQVKSMIELEENKSNENQLTEFKRPRGRPRKIVSEAKEIINEPNSKRAKSQTDIEIKQPKKEIIPEKPQEKIIEEGSTRRKRNVSKPNYCEEEKITKKKKRATSDKRSDPKKKTKSKKEEKAQSKKVDIIRTELSIRNLIGYTWRECEISFHKLLSQLSQHEFITFVRRLSKDYPECICFAGNIFQLKIGTAENKPGKVETMTERMRREIQYYYIFSRYIHDIITFDEIEGQEDDNN